MKASFFFYDLETSGFNPREARIMQFGGQRTDLNLRPIGEPLNVLITLHEDVLPEPDAVLINGITPQKTLSEGYKEADFLKTFFSEAVAPGTIFIGFNSVRFDDEFMRYLLYRNFYDAYEWQWQDDRSRWDLLDVVRMTRALRPEGIKWPVSSEGKPANRLELLTSINKLEHANAHDALSDVMATIDLTRLLKTKQPKLFTYLLDNRGKKAVAALVSSGQPFVYTSGKYPSDYDHTTVVTKLVDHPKKQGALVYDLRNDPKDFVSMSPEKIVEAWTRKRDDPEPRLPVKLLQYNRCPAIAPLGVLDESSQKRLQLDLRVIETNRQALSQHPTFIDHLLKAIEILDQKQQASLLANEQLVDSQLYDGFIDKQDQPTMKKIRTSSPDQLANFSNQLHDKRLKALLPLYKARNFPKNLNPEEQITWEAYKQRKLFSPPNANRLNNYFTRIAELGETAHLNKNQKFLLEELKLYGESLIADQDG